MDRAGMRLRDKVPPHVLLTGVVIGMLIAGLAVPFVFGAPLDGARVTHLDSEPADGTAAMADGGFGDGVDDEALGDGGSDDQLGTGTGEAGWDTPGDGDPAGDAEGGATTEPTAPRGERGNGAAGAGQGDAPGAEGPSGSSPAAGSGEARATLTASDRGVTEEVIRLGILLLDTAALGTIGIGIPGVDPAEEQRAYDAWIAEINERGGINGRMIEAHYRAYDVLSADDMRAACLELTQDKRVFAVIDSGGFYGAPVLCVTEENETPFILSASQGVHTEFYERSAGRLFTTFMAGNRAMANFAAELDRLGALEGRTIGILTDARAGMRATVDHLEATLNRLGYEVAYRATLDADLSTGSSEIPVQVQQMRARGVDGVMLVANILYANQFAQQADNQGYRPQYYATDWYNGATDTFAEAMPASYAGAIAITQARYNEHLAGLPEPEDAARCVQTYAERTGGSIERGDNEYGLYVRGCVHVRLFDQAASRAGAELTRRGFSSALSQLGEVPLGDLAPGSFTRGKPDAADHVRALRYQSDCRCYMPVDSWRRARF